MDKNQAIIDYLITCPQIRDNPLYFNFIHGNEDDKQIITTSNEKTIDKPFIDGSVMKRFTFTIIDFKSVAYRAVVKDGEHPDENVEDILQVQDIIDWITEQNDERNFPDFGSDCLIEEITTTASNPNLNGVDSNASPALAKYSISIQVNYIDYSKVLWH
jgi:hypothetical protein